MKYREAEEMTTKTGFLHYRARNLVDDVRFVVHVIRAGIVRSPAEYLGLAAVIGVGSEFVPVILKMLISL